MQKEIETKARIRSYDEMLSYFKFLGCSFSSVLYQVDRYFCNFDDDFSVWRAKSNFLRIRKEDEALYLTLKQPQSNELDVIEKTLCIDDENSAAEFIELLGYHEVVSVKKERVFTKCGGYTVCLDRVHSLGDFIEVQYTGIKSADIVQKEQKEFLAKCGVSEEDIILHGYDTMVYEKTAIKQRKM